MKILSLAIAAAVAAPLATAGVAHAVPATGIIVGDFQENGPKPLNQNPADVPVYNDFSNGTSNPNFTLAGSSNIYGTVRHKNANNFKDSWTMTVLRDTKISFSWKPHDGSMFDGRFSWGVGTLQYFFDFADVGSKFVAIFTPGTYKFKVDATKGEYPKIEDGYWTLHASVPLPASALLLLSGLGGLAFFRARKSA